MNQRIANRLIEISKAFRPKAVRGRKFHATFILKKSKIVAIGFNDYQKSHREKRFGAYCDHRQYLTKYEPSLHSEISACIKLGQDSLRGYTVANVRLTNDGRVGMSKPCPNCKKVIESMSPKTIFFTNNSGEFEICQ